VDLINALLIQERFETNNTVSNAMEKEEQLPTLPG